jgi:tetratricopeptide (TPR) repeat protein
LDNARTVHDIVSMTTDIRFAGSGDLEVALANGRALLTSDPSAALAQAREILGSDPHNGDALRLLGAALRRMGDDDEASKAELEAIKVSAYNPTLVAAARAISGKQWVEAERLLRPYIKQKPDDTAALNMLAKIASHVGAYQYAEGLLLKVLEAAPRFTAARLQLADALLQQGRRGEALKELDAILSYDPGQFKARIAKATTAGRIGAYQEALQLHEELLAEFPRRAPIWMFYGHLLKAVGRLEDAIAAYRKALELDPAFGEAWWGLANLKTVKLGVEDRRHMETGLEQAGLADDVRLHLHFALGKAHEDEKDYKAAFRHYEEGNAIRRAELPYDAGKFELQIDAMKATFTRELAEDKKGQGCAARDPIFILGMPRAGSTLLEQILASHSLIEGTSELPHIIALTQKLRGDKVLAAQDPYPRLISSLEPERLRELGEEYLRNSRVHRTTQRPFFIDKQPNNWSQAGFIHLILPNAKIIDARRHPLSCCFSNFKQHFARGQAFSYSLEGLGHYYRQYVRLMSHFDDVLPGRVYRVIHEELVENPEAEIRRLLDYLELPFEEECLRFHENDRAVWTPSSQQVRQPINRQGMDQWRPFEPWLGPLKDALGPVLDAYPEAPAE